MKNIYIDISIDTDKDNLTNIYIDIDIVIPENIDIDIDSDMDFLENIYIDIDKGISLNIDIDRISYEWNLAYRTGRGESVWRLYPTHRISFLVSPSIPPNPKHHAS